MKKSPVVVVFRTSPRAKTHKMLVLKNHLVDEILASNKKKPILPYTYHVDTIGIGESFIENYKEKYKIKTHKELE